MEPTSTIKKVLINPILILCFCMNLAVEFEKLDCDIIFLSQPNFIDDLDINSYDNKIIAVSESDIINENCNSYRQKYPNCKLVFLWMYGEVFYRTLLEKCKKANLDLLLSGSNQIGLDEIGIFDYKLSFKYFISVECVFDEVCQLLVVVLGIATCCCCHDWSPCVLH